MFDLRALEAFQAAMSLGSMTGAARELGCGQPAVTRMIRDLEEATGFQLFHRNGPRISPTDRGLRFYEEVGRLMAGMRQIRNRADAIRDDREPAIDIAATPSMAGGLVAATLARMGDPLPDTINAQTMDAEHVVRALRARTADFGITSFPLDHAGLDCQLVAESQVVAVVARGGPRDRAEPLDLAELASDRIATVANAFRLRRAIDQALEAEGTRPAAEFATNSSLNALMAARSGLGVAVVDPVTAFGIPVEGIAVRSLVQRIPYSWGLFATEGRVISEPMQHFVDGFAAACEAVVPGCIFHDPAEAEVLRRPSRVQDRKERG